MSLTNMYNNQRSICVHLFFTVEPYGKTFMCWSFWFLSILVWLICCRNWTLNQYWSSEATTSKGEILDNILGQRLFWQCSGDKLIDPMKFDELPWKASYNKAFFMFHHKDGVTRRDLIYCDFQWYALECLNCLLWGAAVPAKGEIYELCFNQKLVWNLILK